MVYWVYSLDDAGEVVFYGTTTAPKQQESEHRGEGKVFEKLTLHEKLRTAEEALYWKRVYLSTYRRRHEGRSPKYNLTLAG
jgi:hypothetical protein